MDGPYYDIEIPRRPAQLPCPDDLTVHFSYVKERAALRLDIVSRGETLVYTGMGRVAADGGFFYLPPLSMLDPFLQERRFLPAKNFKIFFRALYPRIEESGIPSGCDLRLESAPALVIEVDSSDEENPVCEISWNADRTSLSFLPDFEDYALSGRVLYPGPRRVLGALAHMENGRHTLRAQELARMRGYYRDAPYLFKVRAGRFTPSEPQFALPRERSEEIRKAVGIEKTANAEVRFSVPKAVQQTLGDFLDLSLGRGFPRAAEDRAVPAAAPKEIGMDGPALLSFSHRAHVRSENGKFTFFILEAKRFADFVPEKAPFVPFVCYFPMYSKMSREQRAWYFYWRQTFREGTALKTDLTYIFVLIYELINRAYGTAQENLDTLLALWKAYRKEFARLDYYMPVYCADFMIVNGMTDRLGEILDFFPFPFGYMRPFAELYLNETLKNGIQSLDFDLLCQFSDYNVRQSRFYAVNAELCRKTIAEVFSALDAAQRAASGQPLLAAFRPEPVTAIWTAYSGAVCGRAAARQIEAQYLPFISFPALRDFVTGVIKHTENALRKQRRYAGRLRGYTLSRDVLALIERVTGASLPAPRGEDAQVPAEPPKPVEIDLEKARALERNSWENTRRLIDAVDQAQEGMRGDALFDAPPEPEPEPVPPPAQPETDLSAFDDVYDAYLAALSPSQRAFLSALLAGGDYAALSALAAQEFSFPEAFFEALNDLAQTLIGDIILSPDGGEVYEEHADALRRAARGTESR